MPAARIGDQTRKKRENGVTRDVVFKMERPGLVEVGQTVEVTESVTHRSSLRLLTQLADRLALRRELCLVLSHDVTLCHLAVVQVTGIFCDAPARLRDGFQGIGK